MGVLVSEASAGPDGPGGRIAPARPNRSADTRSSSTVGRSETRFELRDPFAEVTHRSLSFDGMSRTADRLGAVRFVAVEPDGGRVIVAKAGDRWVRPSRTTRIPHSGTLAHEPATRVETPLRVPNERATEDTARGTRRQSRLEELEAGLSSRFVISHAPVRFGEVVVGQTQYRHRSDTSRVAFTASSTRLRTDTSDPVVARSMVDLAEARGWRAIRVSGSDAFKRTVWLEASLRELKSIGYAPQQADRERLRSAGEVRERDQVHWRPTNDVQPNGREATHRRTRKAVLAALDAVLTSRHVPSLQRDSILTAAAERLSQREQSGQAFRVRVYDHAAPSRHRSVASSREKTPAVDRSMPAR